MSAHSSKTVVSLQTQIDHNILGLKSGTSDGFSVMPIPGLDNLFTISQILEIFAHGFCLLTLKLNGYLVTAAAKPHNHYSAYSLQAQQDFSYTA